MTWWVKDVITRISDEAYKQSRTKNQPWVNWKHSSVPHQHTCDDWMNSSLSPGVPFTEFERIAFFIFCCGFYPVHDNLLSAGRTFIKLKSCAKLKRSNNQGKKELRAFEVHNVEGDQNPCQTISRWLKFKDVINKVSENI